MKFLKLFKEIEVNSMKAEKYRKNPSYTKIINIYLLVCIFVLIISIPIFTNLINQHDLEMSKYICNLIAEKMNNYWQLE